jgi:hypothetical protein
MVHYASPHLSDAHLVSSLLTRLLDTGISAEEYRQLSDAADRLAASDSVIPNFLIDSDTLHRLGDAVHRSDQCTVAEILLYLGLGFAAAFAWSMVTDNQHPSARPDHVPAVRPSEWRPKTAEAAEMGLHDFRRAC